MGSGEAGDSAKEPGHDPAAFYRAHAPELTRFATSLVGPDDAADVVADAYSPLFHSVPQLLAIRNDATTVRSWRLFGANGNQPFRGAVPMVGDFNRDGNLDIGLTYKTVTGGTTSGKLEKGVATVLTTGTPFRAVDAEWPMPHQNRRNTAVLTRSDVAPPTIAITSPAAVADGGEVIQHGHEKPAEPHAFAPAGLSNAIHAVVPVSRADEWEPVSAVLHRVRDGADGVFEHGPGF